MIPDFSQIFPFNVSRETLKRLEQYVELISKWSAKINLIGKSTRDEIWNRHIIDSLQLSEYTSNHKTIVDLGAGAGLPGLVIAIQQSSSHVTLIESNQKKAQFMKTVVRTLDLKNVSVICDRIENVENYQADIIISRALANLDLLLQLSSKIRHQNSECVFLKGKTYTNEINAAKANWEMTIDTKQSITNNESKILVISHIKSK